MEGKCLKPAQESLLREVISKRNPALLRVIDEAVRKPLIPEMREALREVIADELCETGLREDDEPNERGLLLEDLIDILGGPVRG